MFWFVFVHNVQYFLFILIVDAEPLIFYLLTLYNDELL